MESESEYWSNNCTFSFLTPRDSVSKPWWGSKCTEMALLLNYSELLYNSSCRRSKNIYLNLIGLYNGAKQWILVERRDFLFLTPHDSTPMHWWGSKCTEMALATEVYRITTWFIIQPFQEYICQSHSNVWWIQKVNIGLMMVPSVSHSSGPNTYVLVGMQIYRNGSSYWTIQNSCIIRCADVVRIYIPY